MIANRNPVNIMALYIYSSYRNKEIRTTFKGEMKGIEIVDQ